MPLSIFSKLLCALCFLSGFVCSAQIGWQWGSNSDSLRIAHVRSGATAADRYGNVYSAATIDGGPEPAIRFGVHVVYTGIYKTLCVTKTDAAGNYLWAKGTQNSDVLVGGMQADSLGNVYVIGCYPDSMLTIDTVTLVNPSSNHTAYFLMKLSPSGNVLWAKNVKTGKYKFGWGSEKCYVAVDNMGNAYVTGSFYDTVIIIKPVFNDTVVSEDIFLAKYNTNGGFCWEKKYGGKFTDFPTAIAVTDTGSIYLSGQFNSDSIKIGTTTLINSSPATTFPHDYFCFLSRIDSAGNAIWAQNLLGHLYISGMTTGEAGCLYACGSYNSTITLDSFLLAPTVLEDAVTAKITALGNVVWARTASGTHNDIPHSIALGICGRLWVCGTMGEVSTTGTPYRMNFDGHVLNSPAYSESPVFIVAYDTSGNYVNGLALPGGGSSSFMGLTGIAADNTGNFYVSGSYMNVSMVFGDDTLEKPRGVKKLFVAKYAYDNINCNAVRVNEFGGPSSEILLYPNPATGSFTVKSNTDFAQNAKVELYDLTGRLVNIYPLYGGGNVISVMGLSSGIYHCRVINGDDVVIRKLAVMR